MDTITHGIVGALTGKALFAGRDLPASSSAGLQANAESSLTARVAIMACTVGSIFPDIDIFAGSIAKNPLALMEWHRNITHSLLMLPIWALLLAAMSMPIARWLKWKPPSFALLTLIYAVGLGTHIFLDVVTNFGTMVWSPLNYSRVAWDWLFILDFILSATALVPQLAAWSYREPATFRLRAGLMWSVLTLGAFVVYLFAKAAGYGFAIWVVMAASALMAVIFFGPAIGRIGFQWRRSSWCRAGLAAVCIYLGCAAMAHRRALADTETFAAAHNLHVNSLAALALPPTLTHWAGAIATPEGVWRITFHVPGGKPEQSLLYSSDDQNQFVTKAKQLRDVQVYLWFARFPIWKVQERMGQTVAEVTDVRFFRDDNGSDPQQLKSRLRPNPASFTFQVVFDAAGRVISHGFKKPE
jgi:membrane-bound metal-dependent hydrolase YbcI (DUF457 family)